MNPLTRTTPAVFVLDIKDHLTGEREERVVSLANVDGVKLLLPDGTEVDVLATCTVPEPGRIRFTQNLTMAGMHEVVAMLSYGGQTLPTSVFRRRVEKDRYGEVIAP